MLLRAWKRLGRSFLQGHSSIFHYNLEIFVRFVSHQMRLLTFHCFACFYNAGQLIRAVRILYPKNRLKSLGRLVEILTVEGMEFFIELADSCCKSSIPVFFFVTTFDWNDRFNHVATLSPRFVSLRPL